MLVSVKNQDGLSGGLTQLLNQTKRLFYQGNFETTMKHSKRIAKQLVYFLKRIKFSSQQKIEARNSILQCLKLITWLVDSSQFRKFGHIFPLCGYVTKIFNRLTDKYDNVDKGQYHQCILRRIEKNQSSPFYNPHKKWQILAGELHYLKNYRFEKLIASLESKKIIFPNPQCVCCSQIFMNGAIVLNNNPMFTTLLGTQTLASESLEKLLNSIANQNGGVILIGSKKILNNLKVQGLQFQTFQQISQAQKLIRLSILKIKPECNFQIQKVPVQNHFLQAQDLDPKNNGLCFRVQIFPQQQNKITYLEFTSKNKLLYHETYQLNADRNPVEMKFSQDQLSMYTIMHRKYYKGNLRKANSHQGLLCFRPAPLNPFLLNKNFANQNMTTKVVPKQSEKQYTNQLKFKYSRVSLLIVNSIKDDRYIQAFSQYLQQNKIEFWLKKAFSDTFKCNPGDRSVWIISHKMSFVDLRTTLSDAQKEGPKIKQAIKTMPVQKILQIQAAKYTPYSQKIMQNKFKDRYPQGYLTEEIQIVDKKKQQKKLVFLTFTDFKQSIYAFMIMQELNLKPFFTKQGQVYQKK